ncbi:MAG: type IX secretion system membrane protein PorP/SprF [Cytophagales bacterium]|nr:type IX secretion system membrane protein PorP/SprF [Cytophagales bacterium]
MLKSTSTIESLSTSLYSQHAYAIAASVFQLSYRIKLKPWILARMVSGAPISLDYAATLRIDDSYTIGLFIAVISVPMDCLHNLIWVII